MFHRKRKYPTPDRRGGRMNQGRPKLPRHHVHRMARLGADFAFCGVAGCGYAEYQGKSVTGRQQRARVVEMMEGGAA